MLLSKGNHRTRVWQPQRDIDREKGRERERERGKDRERDRERAFFVVLRHYIARQYSLGRRDK